MARIVNQRFMTSRLLLFHLLLQLVAIGRVSSRAHPPRSAGAVRAHWETEPWHRIDSESDVDVAESSVDWSADGVFGRRLSVIQRRNGATVPPEAPQLIMEASTKLVGVTRQLRPKTEKDASGLSVRPESSTPKLIRTRLPSSNRTNGVTSNITDVEAIINPNISILNKTIQTLSSDSISPPVLVTEPTEERVTEQVVIQSSSTSSNPIVAIAATEISTSLLSTTSASQDPDGRTSDLSVEQVVAIPPETTTTVRSTTTTMTTTTSPSTTVSSTTAAVSGSTGIKPLWRVRMEQNLSNRRQQSIINLTVKHVDADISPESEIPTATVEQKPNKEETIDASSDVLPSIISPIVRPQVLSVNPSIEQVESSVSTVDRIPLSTIVFHSPISRPIFSTRVPFSSALPSQGARTPHVTARIIVPVSQLSLTRLNPPPPPPSTRKEDALEAGNDDFNDPQISSTTAPALLAAMTTTIEPTTIRKVAPPTPVMHSLEDILQRLVPTKDDSFGHNPFLATGSNSHGSRHHHRNPSSFIINGDQSVNNNNNNNNNEIVSTIGYRDIQVNGPRAVSGVGGIINGNSSSTDPNDSQSSATSIYIIGVVAIIPLAGAVLWIVRVQMHKRRDRLNESETSSETETGFRKTRLPPVALTTSKHARLFYGPSDKEDLVPGGGGSASSNKTSPLGSSSSSTAAGGNGVVASRHSPWEFKRSNLRLQTLIGEGNFGQVWKAEAEDICGCQGTLLVAVKTVKDGATSKEKQELLREMKIMQQLGPHPNVVALLGCCTEQEPFLLIMEYVMYGRLLTFLREHRTQQTYYNYSSDNEALTSRDLTTFAYCVAKGMEFIYSKGVVHRDLAARNVLVDHNKLCKVADFGLSRSVRDTAGEMYEQRVKGALPIRWMAPESLIQSVFTQKSDVWSFGILIWEIVTLGSTPYPGMEAREVMRRVKDGHRLERPNHCRTEFYRLMSRCWHSDPQRRPDFGELKAELGQLLDDADGYIDLDNFQESIYVPLESPSDESEKV